MTDTADAGVKKSSARKKKTTPETLSFEAAMERLEVIVKALEGDAVSLDESLSLYEEGVALIRRCNGELDTAEQRVRILQKTPDGEIRPAAFAAVEE